MSTMMNDKVGLKSIEQTVRHYEIAFGNWNIELNEATKREIKHRSTLIWNVESTRSRQQLTSMKVQQVDDLLETVPKAVEYCLTAVGEDFKRQLENIDVAPRSAFPLLSEATTTDFPNPPTVSLESPLIRRSYLIQSLPMRLSHDQQRSKNDLFTTKRLVGFLTFQNCIACEYNVLQGVYC